MKTDDKNNVGGLESSLQDMYALFMLLFFW